MHFATSFVTLLASAAVASAASVSFWTLDKVERVITFTPNPGSAPIAPVKVDSSHMHFVEVPSKWQGNFFASKVGGSQAPGMLGELDLGSWGDLAFYDVSAIVDPDDTDNIKQMWPVGGHPTEGSGCESFICDNVYVHPNDEQTKSTTKSDFIVTLGTGSHGL